jgi:hypothetical protein
MLKGTSVISVVSVSAYLLFLSPATFATETRWRPRHISRGDKVGVEVYVMNEIGRSAVYALQGPRCRNEGQSPPLSVVPRSCRLTLNLAAPWVGEGNATVHDKGYCQPWIYSFACLDPLYDSFSSQCSSAVGLSYC